MTRLGQKGYIQDRLKRIRRALKPEDMQRPRSSKKQLDTPIATDVQSNDGLSQVIFHVKTQVFLYFKHYV